jgi:hypothetical protein
VNDEHLPHLREKLGKLLVQVFQRPAVTANNSSVLHYYQVLSVHDYNVLFPYKGFHDIATILLLMFDYKDALKFIQILARTHLRYIDTSFDNI